MAETQHITRRSAFAGLSAAIIGTGFSSAAKAATFSDPDAELLALGRHLADLHRAHLAAEDEAQRLFEIYFDQEPACPEALIWKPSDPDTGLFPPTFRDSAGRRAWGHRDEVDRLRVFQARGHINGRDRERALIRAQEIVATFDEWTAAKAQARRDVGCMAAEERSEALFEDVQALGAQISRMPARTLQGLIVKARAVECFNEEARHGDLREDPTTDVLIAGALVRDLLAMAEA